MDHRGYLFAGDGLTLDMSGNGIRFSIQEKIEAGRILQVSVDWPVRLDGICPMKVVAVGRVVRSDADWAAVSIMRYEFRIKGSGLAQGAAMPKDDAEPDRRRTRLPKSRKSPAFAALARL